MDRKDRAGIVYVNQWGGVDVNVPLPIEVVEVVTAADSTPVEDITRPWRHPMGEVVDLEYPPDRPAVVDLVLDTVAGRFRTAETRGAAYALGRDGVWDLARP
jgi:hypothetical protein